MTTVVVVEGEEDIILVGLGKFENLVPKVVKVEVTAAAAKLSGSGLATAWTRTPVVVDPSRATRIYPAT